MDAYNRWLVDQQTYQPAMDAIRMPAILKFVVRVNSMGLIVGLQMKHLLENLLQLDGHKPAMILEALVNCLTSIPWMNSVTEIIDTLLCSNDFAWPGTGMDSPQYHLQWDHIDTWFQLLDAFIVNEAWPQLRPPLLEMRTKHLQQLEQMGYDVIQFYECAPDIEDGTGTEETEIHGDFHENDVAGSFQDSDAQGSQMHLDQGNHSPISAQKGADPLAPQHSTNGADLTTGSPTVCLDGLDALMNLNQQPVNAKRGASSSPEIDSSHPSKRHRGQTDGASPETQEKCPNQFGPDDADVQELVEKNC
jgi:hypothetical protein